MQARPQRRGHGRRVWGRIAERPWWTLREQRRAIAGWIAMAAGGAWMVASWVLQQRRSKQEARAPLPAPRRRAQRTQASPRLQNRVAASGARPLWSRADKYLAAAGWLLLTAGGAARAAPTERAARQAAQSLAAVAWLHSTIVGRRAWPGAACELSKGCAGDER